MKKPKPNTKEMLTFLTINIIKNLNESQQLFLLNDLKERFSKPSDSTAINETTHPIGDITLNGLIVKYENASEIATDNVYSGIYAMFVKELKQLNRAEV